MHYKHVDGLRRWCVAQIAHVTNAAYVTTHCTTYFTTYTPHRTHAVRYYPLYYAIYNLHNTPHAHCTTQFTTYTAHRTRTVLRNLPPTQHTGAEQGGVPVLRKLPQC